jgi:DNA repair exonuclease SbcCD ATPase subunit
LLLDRLFQDEQRSLARQFTQPFADRISGYLQCIFGAGALAQVDLDSNEFTGLRLSRLGFGNSPFEFDNLSGGTREQTAAAVRLAMAEVLAADHGGCLPVIFDDAFAYADPERVNQLQRMLDLAATRGLQVIVLTCNPSDYASLGAKTVTLSPSDL